MPRVAEEVIEQIAAANDIVEVIGAYFPLKRAGATYKALCPFHQERSPSFTVNPHRQIFKCFGCGAGGSVFRFVQDYEHLSFMEAVRKLAERAGIRLQEVELSPDDQHRLDLRRRLLALHADAAEWFHRQLLKQPSAQPARDYLKSRGFTNEVAKSWKLGFAPNEWDSFHPWARQQGYSGAEILQSGLVSRRHGEDGGGEDEHSEEAEAQCYDRFRNRVMFPICNDRGEVIAFSGRTLEANPKAAKYVNSPETPLFVKGAVLFGLHRTVRALIEKKSAIVCEGQIDLITAVENSVPNVIAPQGTAFTERQAAILKRYVEEVVLCFDSDAAGEKAAERSLEALLGESLTVRIAAMPPGEDPDSLIRSQGGPAFLRIIEGARDFFEYQIERLARQPEFQTPRGRANAARRLAGWVALIKDAPLREAVMSNVALRLEMSIGELAKLLPKARAARRDEGHDPAPVDVATPLTDPAFRLLALAALHDQEACEWLRQAPYRELLEREPEASLVLKILESPYQPADRATQNALLTSLEAADEATISTLLAERAPLHAEMVASDCWNEIARRQVQRHLDSLQARLRSPALTFEESMELQKEVLDHQHTLLEIARPLSPPL